MRWMIGSLAMAFTIRAPRRRMSPADSCGVGMTSWVGTFYRMATVLTYRLVGHRIIVGGTHRTAQPFDLHSHIATAALLEDEGDPKAAPALSF